MTDVKRLLDEATPLPWKATRKNHWSWIGADDGVPAHQTAVCTDARKPDAALIVYAVNRLPDYEAAVDALERLVAFDEDPGNLDALDEARAVLRRLRPEVPA